ncbi:hypothetical protein ACIGCZ_37335 [Streptomyces nigra]|uniref:hypothetical protein n=1 Tax=Streptomyces nigra TaxID=1827580 RepID=UPI0037CCF2A4
MAEAYPTPLAGQRITASLLRSMQPQVARKTADTQRAATTTAVADPHLTFEVEANAAYIWDGWLKYDGATGGDLIVDFTAPTGALGEWGAHGAGIVVIGADDSPLVLQTDTVQSTGYMVRLETNDVAQFRTYGTLGTGNALTLLIAGTLRTASTGGTFSLDWAQGTSSATNTTLFTDSWLKMQRVA